MQCQDADVRRRHNERPANPSPSSAKLPGSGTGVTPPPGTHPVRHVSVLTLHLRNEDTMNRINLSVAFLTLAVLLATTSATHAVDGQVLINQARAMAGGVTSGDTPASR